jgi:hypothetical protein
MIHNASLDGCVIKCIAHASFFGGGYGNRCGASGNRWHTTT